MEELQIGDEWCYNDQHYRIHDIKGKYCDLEIIKVTGYNKGHIFYDYSISNFTPPSNWRKHKSKDILSSLEIY